MEDIDMYGFLLEVRQSHACYVEAFDLITVILEKIRAKTR